MSPRERRGARVGKDEGETQSLLGGLMEDVGRSLPSGVGH